MKDRTNFQKFLGWVSVIMLIVVIYYLIGAIIHIYNDNIVAGLKFMIPSVPLFIVAIWLYQKACPNSKVWPPRW